VILTYTVASPPIVSITKPASGARYARGQVVDSSFTCSEGAGGTGIASCVDQDGHSSGVAIDTSTTGSHSYTVTATSKDGLSGTKSITYTVYARDGSGTLRTATRSVSASSTHHTLTFTYTAAAGGVSDGAVTLVVPSGWSAPSTAATKAGYTSASVGSVSVSGHTITVSTLTLAAKHTLRIVYGARGRGGPGATAPSATGAQTWQAKQKSVHGATLKSLSGPPRITIT
jgi:hypothetical protein